MKKNQELWAQRILSVRLVELNSQDNKCETNTSHNVAKELGQTLFDCLISSLSLS